MAPKRRLKKKSRTQPLKMIKVHYCNNCHYVWDKASDERYCPYCSSELYTILKLTCQCWQNLQKIYVSSEEKQSEEEEEEKKPSPPKEPALEDILPLELESMPALAVSDRRSEIEWLYQTANNDVRSLIEHHIQSIIVDSKDEDFLTTRISHDGHIEIIDEANGKVIPWHRLNDDEQYALFMNFSSVIDDISWAVAK